MKVSALVGVLPLPCAAFGMGTVTKRHCDGCVFITGQGREKERERVMTMRNNTWKYTINCVRGYHIPKKRSPICSTGLTGQPIKALHLDSKQY